MEARERGDLGRGGGSEVLTGISTWRNRGRRKGIPVV